MKVIKSNEAERCSNSDKCKTVEYSFGDKDIDLGLAIITGRYPEKGYCVNLVSKELVYIMEGSVDLCFEGKIIALKEGDSILINPNEKYYWQTEYCKVSMTCTPAWNAEQHKLVE